MTKTIFAVFLALAMLPAARAQQARLIGDTEDGEGKAQLLDSKIMEDAEGVVVLEAEKPAAKPEEKKAAEPAAKPAEAKPAEKAAPKPAEKKPAAPAKTKATVKPAEKAAPAAAKPAEKTAAPAKAEAAPITPVEAKTVPAKPSEVKPAAAPVKSAETKPAAKPAAAAKPAVKTAPAAAKPAAKPAAAAPAVKTEVVEALPATFEVQAPAKAAPAKAAAVPAQPAAAAPVKPAAVTPSAAPAKAVTAVPAKPSEAKPAAAAAKTAAESKPLAVELQAQKAPEQKPAEGEGFAVDKKHLVTDGDTLWDLSGKYYHDPYKWGKIYNANLNTVQDPDRIYPKSELVIPGITEEVRPERTAQEPEAAPEGEGGVSDLRFEKAEAEPEGGGEVAQKIYARPSPPPAPAAAPVIRTAPKVNVIRDDLDAYSKNDLSSEMPVDQKEWSTFTKVVPDNWQPDAVVTGRVKTGYDSVDEGLSFSGEKVTVKLASGVSVKAGDMMTLYLRGAAAFDKKGKRIGRELQPAGTAQVVSAGDGTAVINVIDASSSVRKGMVAKVTMRF